MTGRVCSISRNTGQDKELGLVYMATITLDRAFIDAEGSRVAFSPAMSLAQIPD